ncbi:MAG: AMP-binding protein, partial [Ignavibacteriales bacterium]
MRCYNTSEIRHVIRFRKEGFIMGWHSITLQTLAANSFKKNRDRVFGKFEEQEITYMELDREANRLANAAISKGLHPGDRVGILVSNSLEFVVIYFGLLKAGLTVVALNDLLGEREASFILADSGVKMAFVGPLFMEKIVQLKPELPELKTVVAVHCEAPQGFTSWEDFKQGHPITDPSFNVGPEDEAIIIYTGGTTGIPKGVVHSQEGLVFNIAQHCMEFNWNENEKILLMTPLAHAAGLIMMVGMVKGATHVIEKWFNPVRALELIQNEKITLTMMVPTIIYVLLDMLKQQPFDVSSLTTILYGAAPITEKRLAEALEVFGPIMRQAYGQTECPNLITTLTPGDHLKAVDNPGILGSCGRPVHLASLVILDTEGNEAAIGQPGEIAIKSPCIMKGYNKKPEATKAAFNKDGWLMTGDMG